MAGSILLALVIGSLAAIPVLASKPIEMSVAAYVSKETVEVQGLYYLKEILEERSGGEIKVNVFYGGMVGGESETIEQVRMGTLQLSIGAWATIDLFARDYMPWVVPYLFPDKESVRRSWEGPIGDALRKAFAEKANLIFCGVYFRGNRQLTSNRRVVTVQDAKDMKIRLPETAAWIEVWKELGCLPTPIPSPEVFGALQMGVVEAQENPISSIHEKRLWEVQKYLVLTDHIVDFNGYFMNKPWFENLSPKHQELVMQAVQDALAYTGNLAAEREQELLEDLKKNGMEVVIPDKDEFRKKAAPAAERLKVQWAPWVYEEALKCAAASN